MYVCMTIYPVDIVFAIIFFMPVLISTHTHACDHTHTNFIPFISPTTFPQQVEDFLITHTAVVDQPLTNTITVTSLDSDIIPFTTTELMSAFVTHTEYNPFYLTSTTSLTWYHEATQTVTSISTQTIHATVTITDRQYVTRCDLPMITYDH